VRSKLFGNFLISVPFVNHGGLRYKSDLAADLLLEEAEGLQRSPGATHVELRHVEETLKGIPTRLHKVTMILDLAPDIDAQWRSFNAKLRNQIRKAEKSGLRFEIGQLELLDRFYEVSPPTCGILARRSMQKTFSIIF
jgi:hypothetical protein